MSIWLVEDDPSQAELILGALRDALPKEEFRHIKTERGFFEALDDSALDLPSVIILDVMLPWTELRLLPSGELDRGALPAGYDEDGGFYRAGVRCLEEVRRRENTRSIPVIWLTVLTNGDLSAELGRFSGRVVYVSKREKPEKLIATVRGLIQPGQPGSRG
jgi:DNA-binding response OmpR family regulator